MTILVLVPTRGRPDNALRLCKAWEETVAHPEACRLVFGVDEDDPSMEEYLDIVPGWAYVEKCPIPGGLVRTTNVLLARARWEMGGLTYWDVIGSIGDDHVPRTVGWDLGIERAHKGRPLTISYPDDGFQGVNLPTACFLDRRIPETLGWLAPPSFEHLFIDNAWRALGERLRTLRYLPQIVFEHLHPAAKKAEWDETYARGNHGDVWEKDAEAFNRWERDALPGIVEVLRA